MSGVGHGRRWRGAAMAGPALFVALALVACDPSSIAPTAGPSAARPAAAASEAPTNIPVPTAAPTPTLLLAPGAQATEQDGVRLVVTPAASTIDAGDSLDFTVSMTNLRSFPLQYDGRDCFAYLYVEAITPPAPVGREDWAGPFGAFKDRVLHPDPAEHVYIERAATTVEALSDDCDPASGLTSPLAPGATISAQFHWTGSFGDALPTPPESVRFRALVEYSDADGLVTPPPPPSMCPCSRWHPQLRGIEVTGSTVILGKTRQMASLGQLLDAALANDSLRTFLRQHEGEDCIVNLTLPPDQGRFLPAGPGWDLEVLCLHPRRYVFLEINPWTTAIKGERVCSVSCWR